MTQSYWRSVVQVTLLSGLTKHVELVSTDLLIDFFVSDYPMKCLPTCHGPDNPPRYPPVSYLQSQATAQKE